MFRKIATHCRICAPACRPAVTLSRAHYSLIDTAKDALKQVNKKIGEVAAEGLEKAEKAAPSTNEIKGKIKESINEATDKVPSAAHVKKEVKNKVNDAAGKVPSASETEKVFSDLQRKAGNSLKQGADAVLEETPDYEDIKNAGREAHDKAGSAFQEGKEKVLKSSVGDSVVDSAKRLAETVSDTASSLNKKVGEAAAAGIDKIQNAAPSTEQVPARHSKAKAKAEIHNREVDRVQENAKDYKDLKDKGSKVESEQNRADDAV